MIAGAFSALEQRDTGPAREVCVPPVDSIMPQDQDSPRGRAQAGVGYNIQQTSPKDSYAVYTSQTYSPCKRYVFLDRDGVINEDVVGDYVRSADQLKFIPGSLDAIAELTRAGYGVVVVSNQSGVGKGIYTLDDLDRISAVMSAAIEAAGGRILAYFYCPHTDEDQCVCRKPMPGLLHRAAEQFSIDCTTTYMVGDSARDVVAGQAAGCKTILVEEHMADGRGAEPTYIVRSLAEAAAVILGKSPDVQPMGLEDSRRRTRLLWCTAIGLLLAVTLSYGSTDSMVTATKWFIAEMFGIALLLAVGLYAVTGEIDRIHLSLNCLPFLILLAALLISAAFAPNAGLAMEEVTRWTALAGFFLATLVGCRHMRDIVRIAGVVVLAATVMAVYGLAGSFGWVSAPQDTHAIVAAIPLAAALPWAARSRTARTGAWCALAVMTVHLALLRSTSAAFTSALTASLAVPAVFLMVRNTAARRHLRGALAGYLACSLVVVVSVAMLLVSGPDGRVRNEVSDSFTRGLDYVRAAVRLTRLHPIVGAGPGHFVQALPPVWTEATRRDFVAARQVALPGEECGMLWQISASTGLVGSAALVVLWVWALRRSFLVSRADNDKSRNVVAAGVALALLSLLAAGTVTNAVLSPASGVLFATCVGMAAALPTVPRITVDRPGVARPIGSLWPVLASLFFAALVLAGPVQYAVRGYMATLFGRRGDDLARVGKYEQSTRGFARAAAFAPWRWRVLHNLGLSQVNLDDYPAAIESYRHAAAAAPYSPMTRANLGSVLYLAGHADAAVAELRTALDLAPRLWWTMLALGDAYRDAGFDVEAARVYSEAGSTGWLSPVYRYELAKRFLDLSDLEMAATQLDKALDAEPANPELRVARGGVLARLGRHDRARADFAYALSRLPAPDSAAEQSRELWVKAHVGLASTAAHTSVEAATAVNELYIASRWTQQDPTVLELADTLRENLSTEPDTPELARTQLQLGLVYWEQGRSGVAEPLLEAGLRTSSADSVLEARACAALASIAAAAARVEQATAMLAEAEQRDQDVADVYRVKGELALRLNDRKAALEAFSRAVELDPHDTLSVVRLRQIVESQPTNKLD